jgi:prepilin-type N-terminal cleavage/methylation domain-containing protein
MIINKKAFTLLEVIIALILASVLTIGSIKVIENMQHETERFRQQVDDDMTWLTANHHLAKNVRGSSYLEVSNGGNTLTLRGYNDDVKGIYNNDPVGHRITYSVGPNVTNTFQGVNAVFSPPSAGPTGKGWKNGRNIEVIINYSLPFANVLYLRCAADVKAASSPGWVVLIQETNGQFIGFGDIQQTADRGFIVVGSIGIAPGVNAAYLIKLDNEGKKQWSTAFHCYWPTGLSSVRQTSDGGYIAVGTIAAIQIFPVYGITYSNITVKLNSNGVIEWAVSYKRIGEQQQTSSTVRQTFSRRSGGVPTGYMITGMNYSNYAFYLLKVGMDSNIQWTKSIIDKATGYGPLGADTVTQTFDASGNASGFMAYGLTHTSTLNYDMLLVKTNDSGTPEWSARTNSSQTYRTNFVKQLFNAGGAPDGYVFGGYGGVMNLSGGTTFFGYLLKVNNSGTYLWSKTYPGVANWTYFYPNTTSDGGYAAGLSGLSFATFMKMDQGGNVTSSLTQNTTSADPILACRQEVLNDSGVVSGYVFSGSTFGWPTPPPRSRIGVVNTDLSGTYNLSDPAIIDDSPMVQAIIPTVKSYSPMPTALTTPTTLPVNPGE